MTLPDPTIVDRPRAAVNDRSRDPRAVALRSVVALVCAASAGVHAALVPAHLEESRLLGAGFLLTALLLAGAALVVRRPGGPARSVGLALLTIAGCYVLSRTTGLPVLSPEPELVDPVGALTTACEVVAAVAVLVLPAQRKEP